jgi:2,5-diamino-6-(ribosylamino)-4(3H)-pyrimidinone 5'-phosphate reductase
MDRPFVYINMAMTADGKITSAEREYPRFTSAFDRQNMDRLRAEADAILVGAGTLRADNPSLQVRDEAMREYRRSLGKAQPLVWVLVSSSARVDTRSRFVVEAHAAQPILATVEDVPAEALADLPATVEVWKLGRGRVDLGATLRRLKKRGVSRLLVEGGGELNWSFIEADLVDELYVTIAPALLGGREAPTLLEGAGLSMQRQRQLRLLELHREGDELYCRYAVVR